MPIINDIRKRAAEGQSIRRIARELHLHRNTVRKYLRMEDFSPKLPVVRKRKSKLDPFKPLLDGWMEEDLRRRPKDRRTAARMYNILVEEHGFTGSYPLVQRYVKACREQRIVEKGTRSEEGFVDCRAGWEPGTAQADFGEGTFIVDGKEQRLKFFVLSFPHSNVGFTQIFWGETGECVAQGLIDTFEHIGGVPRRIVFDNAAGVGHRMGDAFHETEFFQRLRFHYGFEVTFTNPYSGHEKGNVERKVATIRNNVFCPPLEIDDLTTCNKALFEKMEKLNDRMHYDKQVPQTELFEEDRKALLELPPKPFNARRFEKRRTDKYGRIELDGRHFYSTHPGLQRADVTVGIGAHTVEIYHPSGTLIAVHQREFGDKRTRSDDPATVLATVVRNPGAWPQCSLRSSFGELLTGYLDNADKTERRRTLRALHDASAVHGFDAAVEAAETLIRGGNKPICASDELVLAARIGSVGLDAQPLPGPSLEAYDMILIPPLSHSLPSEGGYVQ